MKRLLIFMLLLTAVSVTAQRKVTTDKLQVKDLKGAKVLGTDEKGNVVKSNLDVEFQYKRPRRFYYKKIYQYSRYEGFAFVYFSIPNIQERFKGLPEDKDVNYYMVVKDSVSFYSNNNYLDNNLPPLITLKSGIHNITKIVRELREPIDHPEDPLSKLLIFYVNLRAPIGTDFSGITVYAEDKTKYDTDTTSISQQNGFVFDCVSEMLSENYVFSRHADLLYYDDDGIGSVSALKLNKLNATNLSSENLSISNELLIVSNEIGERIYICPNKFTRGKGENYINLNLPDKEGTLALKEDIQELSNISKVSLTLPATPTVGSIYFDISTKKLRCYDGETWHDLY